jgi:hypothetical protein
MARKRRQQSSFSTDAELSANRALREQGMLPLRWAGSRARLEAHGIKVETRTDAVVTDAHEDVPGRVANGDSDESLWAPRWAVLVVEAEPCNEGAVDWALARAVKDADFRDALDTIAAMATEQARRRMADYVMEIWEPGEAP